jgi:hypothetical protein
MNTSKLSSEGIAYSYFDHTSHGNIPEDMEWEKFGMDVDWRSDIVKWIYGMNLY